MHNVTLGELIDFLHQLDPDTVLHRGFGTPHSYRGFYDQLAFEPESNARVGDMLRYALSAVDEVFEGYKGGKFWMTEDTPCWIASEGCSTTNGITHDILQGWAEEAGTMNSTGKYIHIRRHRGSLADSMATVQKIEATIAAVADFVGADGSSVAVEFYGYDHRIGWDTYIVTVNGNAVAFTDGPVVALAESEGGDE